MADEVKAWHEDDDFWETMAPFMFTEDRWASAEHEIDQLLSLLNLPSEARILDLGCGPGRHSLELARRGFNVTGVDRTKAYLQQARTKAEDEGLNVTFIEADMREYKRPRGFDCTLSLYTTFGYFEEPDENLAVLENIYHSLAVGGILAMDMMGKEVLARIFQPRDWLMEGESFYLIERIVQKSWRWMVNRWIRIEAGAWEEFTLSHWIYSAGELRSMLTDVGFEGIDFYGDLEGSPYDNSARRLIVSAHKAS